jgi:cation transport regulator ChaB
MALISSQSKLAVQDISYLMITSASPVHPTATNAAHNQLAHNAQLDSLSTLRITSVKNHAQKVNTGNIPVKPAQAAISLPTNVVNVMIQILLPILDQLLILAHHAFQDTSSATDNALSVQATAKSVIQNQNAAPVLLDSS